MTVSSRASTHPTTAQLPPPSRERTATTPVSPSRGPCNHLPAGRSTSYLKIYIGKLVYILYHLYTLSFIYFIMKKSGRCGNDCTADGWCRRPGAVLQRRCGGRWPCRGRKGRPTAAAPARAAPSTARTPGCRTSRRLPRVARGDTFILIENDSNDSKITVYIPKE